MELTTALLGPTSPSKKLSILSLLLLSLSREGEGGKGVELTTALLGPTSPSKKVSILSLLLLSLSCEGEGGKGVELTTALLGPTSLAHSFLPIRPPFSTFLDICHGQFFCLMSKCARESFIL